MAKKSGQKRTAPRARANSWDKAFLSSLRRWGNVWVACAAAKIARSAVYARRERDPIFKAEWDEALEESTDRLEFEARRRAFKGTLKPVFQKGVKVGHIREYSDALMLKLLEAKRPGQFRRAVALSGDEDSPIPIRIVEVVKEKGSDT